MDPSALIFVALAVAWAVYLIPKALEHHEESARARTVDAFSKTMRVLARREPISRRKARLVSPKAALSEERTKSRPTPEPAPLTAEQLRGRRRAAARAAKRRMRVVSLILVANAAVAGLAFSQLIGVVWCAVPFGVLIAWLVTCRLMVKRERAALPVARIPAEKPVEEPKDATEDIAPVDAPVLGAEAPERTPDPDAWDPVYAPLPTYVSKPVARRTVSQIDLDSTGVWSSGRNASDSALAREADAADRPAEQAESSERRASGA